MWTVLVTEVDASRGRLLLASCPGICREGGRRPAPVSHSLSQLKEQPEGPQQEEHRATKRVFWVLDISF